MVAESLLAVLALPLALLVAFAPAGEVFAAAVAGAAAFAERACAAVIW
jgi:hypothetical protein